jgi:two-component system alkaline phosphatase synthesis response regulator PhoP
MASILIAADDQDYAKTLRESLSPDGYEISIIPMEGIAIGKIREMRPDLLIVDVLFPEDKAASFDLARTIRQSEMPLALPVIMLTGVNDEYPFNFMPQDLGSEWFPVSDLLEKPIDIALLRGKITGLLGKSAGHPLSRTIS